jgi:hypothetical protein
MEIIDGCNNLNISITIQLFQTIISALEGYTYVDEIRVLDHQNPADIDEDTIILVIMIQTQLLSSYHPFGCNKCINLTEDRLFSSTVSAFKRSTSVDAFILLDHQNPTDLMKIQQFL